MKRTFIISISLLVQLPASVGCRPACEDAETRRAALLKTRSDWKMQIEGHTDDARGAAFSQTLPEKRAAAVVKYLPAAGIDAARLGSAGAG